MLQERLNKLTEGINMLINSHFRKCRPTQLSPVRSISSGTPRKSGKAVHWKDMDGGDKTGPVRATSSESDPNFLNTSCPMPLPRVTVCNSSSEIDILLNGGEEDKPITTERVGATNTAEGAAHKVLKLPGMRSCSSASSSPPICTIVIEEPDGQIHCPTPSSIADDEVFVL